MQFGELLADARVVDPRGAVSLPYNSGKPRVGEKAIKGYKVRKWRLWGETGKRYLHIPMPEGKKRTKKVANRPRTV